MLFKLSPTKIGAKLRTLVVIGLLINCHLVNATVPRSDAWQVHGFLAQGLIDVDGSNYVNDSGKPSAELTEVGINASYQMSDSIRFAGQAVYLDGGNRYAKGFHIDYLLMDWSLYTDAQWQVNLYLGRIKNYHWLYSSIRDVPMSRPSILLPQSVYFDATRNMSVGGDGVALTAKYFSETSGDFDFNISSSRSKLSDEQTSIILGQFSDGELSHDTDLQASVYWQPDMSSWRFGIALTDADFSYEPTAASVYLDGDLGLKRNYANAEYQGEQWTFSMELLQESMEIDGLVFPGFKRDTTGRGGFAQFEYLLNNDVKLLSRAEIYYADKNDKDGKKLEASTGGLVPRYFGYQHELVIGASYKLSHNMQIQIEQHWVQGTARLTPVVLPDPTLNNQEYWQISALQFVYWF